MEGFIFDWHGAKTLNFRSMLGWRNVMAFASSCCQPDEEREKKKLASDVLIFPFRIQKLLPPNISHLGNNSQAKNGKFLQNSAIDRRVMVAKTLP